MKTYKNLYQSMLDLELIEKCIWNASEDKREKPAIKQIVENKADYAPEILKILEEEAYYFKEYPRIKIKDNQKEREIVTPLFFSDQVLHHVIMSQLSPIIEKSLYAHAYGNIKGRGQYSVIKPIEKWIRSYGNKRFYVVQCDIKQFFSTVDHRILKNKIQRKITDNRYLNIIFSLIDSYHEEPEKGIPKGFYSSQWLGHLYLSDMDHYITEELGAQHYIRYVDDIVIMDTNKRRLRNIFNKTKEYLETQLLQEFKSNWQLFRFKDKKNETGRDIDYVGFRFYRNKTTIRKSSLKSIRRKAIFIDKKKENYKKGLSKGVNAFDSRSMLSRLGKTKHTDVYGWYQREIKPRVNRRSLRKKVSHADKKKNRIQKNNKSNEKR